MRFSDDDSNYYEAIVTHGAWSDAVTDLWYDVEQTNLWHETLIESWEDSLEHQWFDPMEDDVWYDANDGIIRRTDELEKLQYGFFSLAGRTMTTRTMLGYIATRCMLSDLGAQQTSLDANPYTEAYLVDRAVRSDVPVVLDTGCSMSIAPFEEDFVTPVEPSSDDQMHGLDGPIDIKGTGIVEWPIRDVFGRVAIERNIRVSKV